MGAAAAVRHIAPQGSPGTPDALVVYRQSESLFTYSDTMAAVAANASLLAAATLRDPVSGKPCGGGGLLGFSNASLAAYWTSDVGGEIASEPSVDAVFLDSFDKLFGGGTRSENGCAGFSGCEAAAGELGGGRGDAAAPHHCTPSACAASPSVSRPPLVSGTG